MRRSLIGSSHGEELWLLNFLSEGGACLSIIVRKGLQNWLAFSPD